jgi:hypothetical protein
MTATVIVTKDVARLLRAELRSTFPGVKFSVRCSTGSASVWIDVSWSDGPTVSQVQDITTHFEGRSFNSATDSYDEHDTTLVVSHDGEMPVEVRYACDGILTHRTFTETANLVAQDVLRTDSTIPNAVICDEHGTLVQVLIATSADEVCIDGITWHYGNLYAYDAVHLALGSRDLTPARTR